MLTKKKKRYCENEKSKIYLQVIVVYQNDLFDLE